ncbi:MAG: Gfo/Idh/MocA family oxidoreductase [Planctomycetes bacterium]|nr:Gfo/Idh/MocA family oxidoreductase [Planctomycetota bacterium]
MIELARRSFLTTAALSAGVLGVRTSFGGAVANGDERLKVGIIGCGGQGSSLAAKFAEIANVEVVCDPDEARRNQLRQKVNAAQAVSDLRRVLDDKTIDAVVIATPDHWHAPAAILACEAGKHVYVEKPQSHNLLESRWLLQAARRNKVVVQHGTQSRSNPLIADGVQLLREGIIGEVLVARAWNVQRRGSIGKESPSEIPQGIDYDLWVGPAEYMPFQKNRLHYQWHWWYNFGTGDIGNDGTHEIDYARWGLGVEGLPSSAMAMGGKYFVDDDQQYPDTATCMFEWPGSSEVHQRRQLIFEMRLWDGSFPHNCDGGAEFHGSDGRMVLSKRGKLEVFDSKGKKIENPKPKQPSTVDGKHQLDFLNAIREGRKPNADVAIGHDSVALVHFANASIRLGRSLHIDPETEQIKNDAEANQLLGRIYRKEGHWATPKARA